MINHHRNSTEWTFACRKLLWQASADTSLTLPLKATRRPQERSSSTQYTTQTTQDIGLWLVDRYPQSTYSDTCRQVLAVAVGWNRIHSSDNAGEILGESSRTDCRYPAQRLKLRRKKPRHGIMNLAMVFIKRPQLQPDLCMDYTFRRHPP